ncbi:MAG: malto-oligosyltrehalose synthase, partial [Vicinamibacterales bacterium]
AVAGMVNSLAQVVLKMGSPGVPDVYQGADLWDLSLVDPDNRRPVDFEQRRQMLADVDRVLALDPAARAPVLESHLAAWQDGWLKLLVTAAGLRLRRVNPELFLTGGYLPLVTETTVGASLVGFVRMQGDAAAIFVAPRFTAALLDHQHPFPVGRDRWKTSRILLPPELTGRTFRHLLTGAEILPVVTDSQAWMFAGQIFATLPVGIVTVD